MKLSIVIIGRNEERGIAKCVEAAQAASGEIGGAEMIFVDSHSTDRTAEIVRGLDATGDGRAADIVMPRERDLFR